MCCFVAWIFPSVSSSFCRWRVIEINFTRPTRKRALSLSNPPNANRSLDIVEWVKKCQVHGIIVIDHRLKCRIASSFHINCIDRSDIYRDDRLRYHRRRSQTETFIYIISCKVIKIRGDYCVLLMLRVAPVFPPYSTIRFAVAFVTSDCCVNIIESIRGEYAVQLCAQRSMIECNGIFMCSRT